MLACAIKPREIPPRRLVRRSERDEKASAGFGRNDRPRLLVGYRAGFDDYLFAGTFDEARGSVCVAFRGCGASVEVELRHDDYGVDVYINYLRRKVDVGFEMPLIRTVRGVGYQIWGGVAGV